MFATTGAAPPNLPADHRAGWRSGRLPGASQLLFMDEVKSWPNLIQRLKSGARGAASSQPIGRIWDLLDRKLQAKLNKVNPKEDLDPELPEAIVKAINAMLVRRDFYDPKYYRGTQIRGFLGSEALALFDSVLGPVQRVGRFCNIGRASCCRVYRIFVAWGSLFLLGAVRDPGLPGFGGLYWCFYLVAILRGEYQRVIRAVAAAVIRGYNSRSFRSGKMLDTVGQDADDDQQTGQSQPASSRPLFGLFL